MHRGKRAAPGRSPGCHDRHACHEAPYKGTRSIGTEQPQGACMNFQHAPAAMAASRERHSYARLHGHWRRLARGLGITAVACTLGIFLASLPAYLTQLQTPCAGAACSYQQLSPQQVGALTGIGLSLGQYAACLLAIALANILVCLAVSAVIALRRPDDRMAFIVA